MEHPDCLFSEIPLPAVSSWCDDPNRALTEPRLGRCKQLLSRVPTQIESMNRGLVTLQFQSLSVSPHNVNILQGGTQDNGTWQSTGNPVRWINTMIGDAGQSGFDVANPDFRFHTFFDASPDVNFSKGDMADWNWIADPIFGTGAQFYAPIISDPKVSKTMFVGTANVWRTKTWGMGTMTLAEFREQCNEWYGKFEVVCGDWVQIGDQQGKVNQVSWRTVRIVSMEDDEYTFPNSLVTRPTAYWCNSY